MLLSGIGTSWLSSNFSLDLINRRTMTSKEKDAT